MSPLGNSKSAYVDGPAGTALVTTAETVIATLAGIETTPEGDQVIIEATTLINTGAAATGVTLRIRRNALAGPLVGTAYAISTGAGVNVNPCIQVQDSPGEAGGQTYVLTAQQSSATGNGQALAASMQATY